MSEPFEIRPARNADLGTIADTLVEGLATYRRWAPVGWDPPGRTDMLVGLLQRFPRDGSWAHLAFAGSEPAGHIAIRPDRDEADRPHDDVALVTQLFVRERHWGSGLASALLAVGVAGMLERGFRCGRLLVAGAHARARAFYEREGWRATGAVETSRELGLELVEYELDLPRRT